MEIRSTTIGLNQGVSNSKSINSNSVHQKTSFGNSVEKPSFTRGEDEFVLSSEALEIHTTQMKPAEETAAARSERLEKIQAEIALGSYDNDMKLEAALERMFDSILDQEV